jgi:hypothetical protein
MEISALRSLTTLVLTAATGLPTGAAQPPTASRAQDARLLRKVTLHEKGVALSDFCAEVQAQTGVELSASRTVADEKVTVFVEERPARDVMREVARLFSDFWSRSGIEGKYRYMLEQDLKSQLEEEELRNRDQHAALLALDAEMERYRPYLDMGIDQLKKLYAESRSKYGRLSPVVHNAAWAGMQLYFRLTPSDRAALMAGQELVFRPDAASPDRRLPVDWSRPILESSGGEEEVNGVRTPWVDIPGISVKQLQLQLTRSELGQLSLGTTVLVTWPDRYGPRGTAGGGKLAVGRSPSVADPANATANAALRGQAPFDRVISVQPRPSCPVLKSARPGDELRQFYSRSLGGSTGQPHVFSGDIWEAVHRATGLPIMADFYTHMYRLDKLMVTEKPQFDALCTLGDTLGVRWSKDGDFLLCRSTSYFWDKLKEVPNRYLQRWAQDRDANGGLPLEDLLEMGSMTDQQLDSTGVAEGIEHCWGLAGWWYVSQPVSRHDARLLALFTPEQRRRALQPEGLPFQEWTPAQRQAVVDLLQARGDESERLGGNPQPVPPEHWSHAAVLAQYIPDGWYAWQRPPGPWDGPIRWYGGRTAEAALAAVRREYPPASPNDVEYRRMGLFGVSIRFTFPGGLKPGE